MMNAWKHCAHCVTLNLLLPETPMHTNNSTAKGRATLRSPRTQERGFTLIELLVVLVILGLVITLVAPAMIRQLGSAKHKIADQSIERLSGIMDLYRLDVGSYPTTDQGLTALNAQPGGVSGWNGPYLKD